MIIIWYIKMYNIYDSRLCLDWYFIFIIIFILKMQILIFLRFNYCILIFILIPQMNILDFSRFNYCIARKYILVIELHCTRTSCFHISILWISRYKNLMCVDTICLVFSLLTNLIILTLLCISHDIILKATALYPKWNQIQSQIL